MRSRRGCSGAVARRLYADRVGVILTVDGSAGPPAFEQLPAIEVGGLPDDAAAELLRSVAGTPLDPQAVDRVLADTRRNPLALVEVGSHFTAGELAERAHQPEPIPVGQRLKDRYLRRVRGLPADAQEFLLLAAADVSGDLGLVRRAAAEAGIDADAAEKAAESAGLIEVSGSFMRFRHPLMRAAVYHGAADADRRRAHHWLGQEARHNLTYPARKRAAGPRLNSARQPGSPRTEPGWTAARSTQPTTSPRQSGADKQDIRATTKTWANTLAAASSRTRSMSMPRS